MNRIRWDRIFTVLLLLLLPVILTWLDHSFTIGSFAQLPVLGRACDMPEAKALMLWAIVLGSVVLIVRTIKA